MFVTANTSSGFGGLHLGLVIKRIEAWTEWIMKDPYEEKLGHWRFKDGFEFELPQIRTTLSVNNPNKGRASIADESPRYHFRRRPAPGSSQMLYAAKRS